MKAGRGEIGRLLILVWNEPRCDSAAERRLRVLRPGGVLLTCEALRSPGAAAELLKRIVHSAGGKVLLALEEEGGLVDPLAAFLPPLPSPRAVAERGGRAPRGTHRPRVPTSRVQHDLCAAPRSRISFGAAQPPLKDVRRGRG